MKNNHSKGQSVVAIKNKKDSDYVRAVIVGNELGAFWLSHPEHKTYRYCSQCLHTHRRSEGSLPNTCPFCKAKMILGAAAKEYYMLIRTLVTDGNNMIIFINTDLHKEDSCI